MDTILDGLMLAWLAGLTVAHWRRARRPGSPTPPAPPPDLRALVRERIEDRLARAPGPSTRGRELLRARLAARRQRTGA